MATPWYGASALAIPSCCACPSPCFTLSHPVPLATQVAPDPLDIQRAVNCQPPPPDIVAPPGCPAGVTLPTKDAVAGPTLSRPRPALCDDALAAIYAAIYVSMQIL